MRSVATGTGAPGGRHQRPSSPQTTQPARHLLRPSGHSPIWQDGTSSTPPSRSPRGLFSSSCWWERSAGTVRPGAAHARSSPLPSPAHLPLRLQAAGTADLLHVVGGEPQLLLAAVISPPPGREGSISTHHGDPRSPRVGIPGDSRVLRHLLAGCGRTQQARGQSPPQRGHTVAWMVTPWFDPVPQGKRRIGTNSPASFLLLHVLDDGVFGEGQLVLPLRLVVKQGFDCALQRAGVR